jgi:hypothetical protein
VRRIALLTCVIGATLVAGCGVPWSGDAVLLDPSEYVVEIRPISVAPSAQAADARLDGALVYFVSDAGLRARVALAAEEFGIAELLDVLADGPDPADVRSGLRSAVSDRRSLVVDHDVRDAIAYVELADSFGDIPGSEQILFLGQVTLTIVGNNLAESVLYTINGDALAVPGADGAPISEPTVRANYVDLITR